MNFFTSDTHFFHQNIIKHSNRPFSTWQEMNEVLIQNWNDKVGPKDPVYHLGDFAYGRDSKDANKVLNVLKRLNGKKHLIVGNHDEQVRHILRASEWASVKHQDYLTIDKQKIALSHYPMRSWRGSFRGSWMLFGHVHGTLEDNGGLTIDCGVDEHNFSPLSFEEIRDIMQERAPKGHI